MAVVIVSCRSGSRTHKDWYGSLKWISGSPHGCPVFRNVVHVTAKSKHVYILKATGLYVGVVSAMSTLVLALCSVPLLDNSVIRSLGYYYSRDSINWLMGSRPVKIRPEMQLVTSGTQSQSN